MKFYALWLSAVCVAAFILQNLVSGFTSLFLLNQLSFIQPWRFLTAVFLHGSIVHLAYNLFALLFFGLILEKFIGSAKFLLIFIASGILANVVTVNFYNSALGASGAIFGIIGTLTVLKPKMMVWAFSLPMPMFLASALWAVGDIFGIFFPSGTANLAHLSGLAIGFFAGTITRLKKKNNMRRQVIRWEIPDTYMKSWEAVYIKQ